jgi:hypothetical protein
VIICIAEDRPSFEPSIRLLLLSLAEHSGDLPIYLFLPSANQEFVAWLRRDPRITLCTDRLEGASKYNVKPQAMLQLMQKGYDDILWIDSDIIVAQSITAALGGCSRDTIVVTEEALWSPHDDNDAWRARKWGFNVGRVLPFALNTAVVRVTRSHEQLLQRWQDLLQSDEYCRAQTLDWHDRPLHLISDQDALTALLSSDFAHVPLKTLIRGRDIVQYFGPYGFTVHERISMLLGRTPIFIHSQGPQKPWDRAWESSAKLNLKDYLNDVYLDLSPYTLAAIKYRTNLPNDTSWMDAHYILSKVLRALALWRISLVGLPIAILADAYRLAKRTAPTPTRSSPT